MKRDSPLIALYISLTSNMNYLTHWKIKFRKYEWRMIINDRALNNRHGLYINFSGFLLVALLLTLALFASGCGQDNNSSTSENSAKDANKASDVDMCGVRIDDTAWQVFADIAKRHQAGRTVGRDDYRVFADLPIIAHWKESMEGNLSSVRLVNWFDHTFNPIEGKTAKKNRDRRNFSANYAYSIKHMGNVDPLIKRFVTEGYGCKLMKNVNFWISPDVAPDSLFVVFLPSTPEIRVNQQYLFVDTGVLLAGSMDQLVKQLTGILFRVRMQLQGEHPVHGEGEAAVANSVRIMMNQGIIGYIEDQPGTIFSPDHPKLGKFNMVPEQLFEKGLITVSTFNQYLPPMLADQTVMQKEGAILAKTLGGSQLLDQAGFSMSATIAANLSEEELRDSAGSPAAWLTAYQKAAKMNPVPAPKAYTVMDQLHLSMPPFDDVVYEGLLEILNQTFPTP